jgi:aldose 1-epimerase
MIRPFGLTPGGQPASLYHLSNQHLRVGISDFGGRMVSIEMADPSGTWTHVLLGFDSAADYRRGSFGALLGRVANRIADGCITLDGHRYELSKNDRGSTLHGGADGFDKRIWSVLSAGPAHLHLSLESPANDQGFPGALTATAHYRLDGDTLWLDQSATTTQPTVVNLSAHPYFNLAGPPSADIRTHEFTIFADHYLPTNERQIPTGEHRLVAGTAFDFRHPRALSGALYDHCFVLREGHASTPVLAARAHDPASLRTLEVLTTQPGLQFYTGTSLDGSLVGRFGIIYRQAAGFAFEAEDFPNAPLVLRPGDLYTARTGFRLYCDPLRTDAS